jgi:hypothetical protein
VTKFRSLPFAPGSHWMKQSPIYLILNGSTVGRRTCSYLLIFLRAIAVRLVGYSISVARAKRIRATI